jgi:hypothetical protein
MGADNIPLVEVLFQPLCDPFEVRASLPQCDEKGEERRDESRAWFAEKELENEKLPAGDLFRQHHLHSRFIHPCILVLVVSTRCGRIPIVSSVH